MSVVNENGELMDFGGVEFGIFKLKAGVSEEVLLEVAKTAEREFLSQEDGFVAHTLLSDGEGRYADVTFATSKKKAKHICDKWLQNEYTLKYVDLIDPESVDMSFWTRVK